MLSSDESAGSKNKIGIPKEAAKEASEGGVGISTTSTQEKARIPPITCLIVDKKTAKQQQVRLPPPRHPVVVGEKKQQPGEEEPSSLQVAPPTPRLVVLPVPAPPTATPTEKRDTEKK